MDFLFSFFKTRIVCIGQTRCIFSFFLFCVTACHGCLRTRQSLEQGALTLALLMTLVVGASCALRTFRSLPGVYPLDAGSTASPGVVMGGGERVTLAADQHPLDNPPKGSMSFPITSRPSPHPFQIAWSHYHTPWLSQRSERTYGAA